MKANRAYRLIVTRAGRAPALLADPSRIDHIEVVEIDSGEVVLFWDRPALTASTGCRAASIPAPSRTPSAQRSSGARASSSCSRCAGPSPSRSTAPW